MSAQQLCTLSTSNGIHRWRYTLQLKEFMDEKEHELDVSMNVAIPLTATNIGTITVDVVEDSTASETQNSRENTFV
jgi:hypothetical protein